MVVQGRRYKVCFLFKPLSDRLNFPRDAFAVGRTVAKDRGGAKLPSYAGWPVGRSSCSNYSPEDVRETPNRHLREIVNGVARLCVSVIWAINC